MVVVVVVVGNIGSDSVMRRRRDGKRIADGIYTMTTRGLGNEVRRKSGNNERW